MAAINKGLLGHVAASINDSQVTREPVPVGRSAIERQGEGRRRLDAACVIRLDRIVPDPNQPRDIFDPEALQQLAESLKARGQLQPIRVRWDDALDRYVVVVGERRFRAAKLAGMETIACVVMTGAATPEDLLEDQLVENALRQDLRPIEQARSYRALLTARGLTHRQLADRLQISHASIAKALALLELPAPIQQQVEQGDLAPTAAYHLSKLDDPEEQADLAGRIVAGELTRDEAAEAVAVRKASATPKGRGAASKAKGKPASPRPRTFRTLSGKVTVEPKKGAGPDAILEAVEEVARMLRAEVEGRGAEAA